MRIQTFNNNKGLIYGNDSKRIGCDIGGVLVIGATEIEISPGAEAVLPVLCNGSSGKIDAVFTASDGTVYNLDKVTLRGGRIVPPSETKLEFMELRSRIEILEGTCVELRAQIRELSNIFDTNSLNFLINEGDDQ